MPIYDYYSEETGEEKEVFHEMDENPEILDSEGNTMKRKFVIGHGGFKMIKDGTRNRGYDRRYGGRKNKSDNSLTPTESADLKAKQQMEARKAQKAGNGDPYAQFRG